MMSKEPHRIQTISQYHKIRGLDKPLHPLISVVDYNKVENLEASSSKSWIYDFYLIALKRNFDSAIKMKYGQQQYDYDEGVLFFMAPKQLFSIEVNNNEPFEKFGWMLLIHPDYLFGTTLAKTIKRYEFFRYAVNEALFLSEKEEFILNGIIGDIKREYQSNITDNHSQYIIVSHIETLLVYSNRFYERQFITRKKSNHRILDELELLLDNYFISEKNIQKGIPSVKEIANHLHITPNYLSSLLKHLTGQTTQQHIHDKLIEKAKELLMTTSLSVSEIAYELGYEYPQSFTKLFKTKTDKSPLEFRASFN